MKAKAMSGRRDSGLRKNILLEAMGAREAFGTCELCRKFNKKRVAAAAKIDDTCSQAKNKNRRKYAAYELSPKYQQFKCGPFPSIKFDKSDVHK